MSDESLFREVDEEVRREEIENIWKKYGTWILALSLGVILAVGGFKGWQYWQKQQAESGGAAYFEAVKLARDGKQVEADKLFAGLEKSHVSYGLLGKFKQAAALVKSGDAKGAVTAYDAIAGQTNVPSTLKQLAQIKAAYLAADSASLKDMQARVSSFETATSPWRNSARELLAIAAFRGGEYQLADRKLRSRLVNMNRPLCLAAWC